MLRSLETTCSGDKTVKPVKLVIDIASFSKFSLCKRIKDTLQTFKLSC